MTVWQRSLITIPATSRADGATVLSRSTTFGATLPPPRRRSHVTTCGGRLDGRLRSCWTSPGARTPTRVPGVNWSVADIRWKRQSHLWLCRNSGRSLHSRPVPFVGWRKHEGSDDLDWEYVGPWLLQSMINNNFVFNFWGKFLGFRLVDFATCGFVWFVYMHNCTSLKLCHDLASIRVSHWTFHIEQLLFPDKDFHKVNAIFRKQAKKPVMFYCSS